MALTITNLSKTYPNGTQALKNVTLDIPNGMFGLLGPNGAGKSSLMRTIATLQDADTGSIMLDDIDVLRDKEAVRRVLRMKFDAGLFEHPYVDASRANALTATPDAVALAREAAARSVVLLKNDGNLLPLDPARGGTLLVVGTHARDTPIGGYSDKPAHVVSVLEGLQNATAGTNLEVEYAEGVRITRNHVWEQDEVDLVPASENAPLIAEAVEKAKLADVVLLVLGENEQLSREAWAAKHLGDRDSLDLVGQQNELASKIFALGKPTIAVLLNGRPLSVNLLAQRADALVEGWYLGQETGNGLADVLLGKVSPGGKLPVSIPRSVGQLPVFYSRKPSARRGYLFDDTSPLYPFGFGLNYSRFEFDAPKLSKATIAAGDSVDVSVRVRNVGGKYAYVALPKAANADQQQPRRNGDVHVDPVGVRPAPRGSQPQPPTPRLARRPSRAPGHPRRGLTGSLLRDAHGDTRGVPVPASRRAIFAHDVQGATT